MGDLVVTIKVARRILGVDAKSLTDAEIESLINSMNNVAVSFVEELSSGSKFNPALLHDSKKKTKIRVE